MKMQGRIKLSPTFKIQFCLCYADLGSQDACKEWFILWTGLEVQYDLSIYLTSLLNLLSECLISDSTRSYNTARTEGAPGCDPAHITRLQRRAKHGEVRTRRAPTLYPAPSSYRGGRVRTDSPPRAPRPGQGRAMRPPGRTAEGS